MTWENVQTFMISYILQREDCELFTWAQTWTSSTFWRRPRRTWASTPDRPGSRVNKVLYSTTPLEGGGESIKSVGEVYPGRGFHGCGRKNKTWKKGKQYHLFYNIKVVRKNTQWGKGGRVWERKSRFKKWGWARKSSCRELYRRLPGSWRPCGRSSPPYASPRPRAQPTDIRPGLSSHHATTCHPTLSIFYLNQRH